MRLLGQLVHSSYERGCQEKILLRSLRGDLGCGDLHPAGICQRFYSWKQSVRHVDSSRDVHCRGKRIVGGLRHIDDCTEKPADFSKRCTAARSPPPRIS